MDSKEYARNYRNKHKDKYNSLRRDYYIKNKEEMKKNSREYYWKNRCEESLKILRARYHKNKDRILKKQKEWVKNNLDKCRGYKKKDYNKYKSRFTAERKIKIPKGQLCEDCNINPAEERHHEDYDKPLEVKFLCIGCHAKLRRAIL